jgi:hypothetical protein
VFWNQNFNPTNLQTIIPMKIQLRIEQSYHPKKCSFNSFSAMCRWGRSDELTSKSWKEDCHLEINCFNLACLANAQNSTKTT